ncbi:MAG: PAS domain S-box protein [Bacteroidota bacterium]|nr:PAS domain S-box protein [Bacteroidota bacterium]
MTFILLDIQEQYAAGLSEYLAGKGEEALQQAYELGRNANTEGCSILDLLRIHEEAIVERLESCSTVRQSVDLVTSAMQYFAEVLSPFEMTHRGYRDTIEELKKQANELTVMNKQLGIEINERIEAERRLRNSEKLYRTLVDTARDVIYTLSPEGNITSLNPAFETLTGWQCTQWLGKHFASLVHPEDLKRALDIFAKVLHGEEPELFELRVRTLWDKYLIGEFVATPQLRDGRMIGSIGIARDITARREAEEQLRRNEEQFRLITENIADLVVMLDMKGRVLYNSPSYQSLVGNAAPARGTDLFENIHSDDRERVKTIFYDMVKTGKGQRVEYRFVRPDGTIRYIESHGSIICGNDGRTERVIIVSRDSTERRLALEKLKVHEQRLADAQQMAHIGSWEWDIGENKIDWSDELYRIYNLTPEEFAGSFDVYMERIHPEDRDFVREAIDVSLQKQQPFRFEHRIVHGDGAVRIVEARGEVLVSENGTPLKMIGTSQDITERKNADEAVRALAKRVVEAQEEERRRIARELHDDICQRLSAIKLHMAALEEVADKRTSLFKQLQTMRSQIGGAINEVRGISSNLRPTTLDDLGLVTALQLLCREFEKAQRIKVSFSARGIEKSMLDVHKETALYRIAQEALANIAKHANAKKVSLEVFAGDSFIAMTIEDNGKGFDPATPIPSGRKNHSGFGLMNMKERSQLLGGMFRISSSRGKGTKVYLEIPRTVKV